MPIHTDLKSDSHGAFAASRFLHRKILFRLFLGWLFLCLIIGGGILWFEINRIQHTVHDLALKESMAFSGESAHALDQLDTVAREHLTQLATQLVRQHFLVAELYDVNKQLQLEVVRPGLEKAEQRIDGYRHRFPNQGAFSREFHFIDGKLLLVMLVPITGSNDSMIGYFEGIYQVDDQTLHAIIDDLLRTLAFVTVAITFTTLLMYPIIYTLNRALTNVLGDMLKGNLELMNVLGCAIAERDSDTNTHNYRVTYYAMRLGEAIGLPQENLRDLIVGAFLHDVGKIGIRDPILLKPGKLTTEEFEIMKTHVTLGVEIVTKSSWLNDARQVVEFHHEKYDGTGYLQGLKGEDIPLNARIFTIVDVFDALTARRAYKESWTTTKAIALLNQESGTHFDPRLVSTFSKIVPHLQMEIDALAEPEIETMVQRLTARYVLINA
jgi:putative nucleotidyltransferase with HDIG domain